MAGLLQSPFGSGMGCGGNCGCSSCQSQAMDNAQMNPCSTGPGTPPPMDPGTGGGLDGQPTKTGGSIPLLPSQTTGGYPLSNILRTISDGAQRFFMHGQVGPIDPTTDPLPTGNNPFPKRPISLPKPRPLCIPANPGKGTRALPVNQKNGNECDTRCVSKQSSPAYNEGAASLPIVEMSNLWGGVERAKTAAQNLINIGSNTNMDIG